MFETLIREKNEDELSLIIEDIDEYFPVTNVKSSGQAWNAEPSFLRTFWRTPGCLGSTFTAFLIGSVSGMVIVAIPEVMADKFARLNHGYTGDPCHEHVKHNLPKECHLGFNDAQTYHVWSNFSKNVLLFFFSSVVGSVSDGTGRRLFLIVSIFLQLLPQSFLVLTQVVKPIDPVWYYVAYGCTGFVDWLPVIFSALADVLPVKMRAPGYAMVIASFLVSLAGTTYFATILTYLQASFLSIMMGMVTLLNVMFFAQETLSPDMLEASNLSRRLNDRGVKENLFVTILARPFRDLSILKRSLLLVLLSCSSLVTSLTYATDHTFMINYVENHLRFTDKDTAVFVSIISVCAIVVHLFLLKELISCFGEKRVLIFAVFCGIVHNFLYGIAKERTLVYVAGSLSSLTLMSYPVQSAMQSYNCAEHEQGQIQGAFFALNSLARAVGPSLMLTIYDATDHKKGFFGPGTMFLVISFANIFALICSAMIPVGDANCKERTDAAIDLNQLLLFHPRDDDDADADAKVDFFTINERQAIYNS